MKLGLLPIGRPTFDVPFAKQKLAGMLTPWGTKLLEPDHWRWMLLQAARWPNVQMRISRWCCK